MPKIKLPEDPALRLTVERKVAAELNKLRAAHLSAVREVTRGHALTYAANGDKPAIAAVRAHSKDILLVLKGEAPTSA
jgi:hypothetical protein